MRQRCGTNATLPVAEILDIRGSQFASRGGRWRHARVHPLNIRGSRAIAAWPGSLAWAQKTDIVRLANGDRVTGEIENLQRGRLELSTDDAGTIEFEWDNIASVESKRQFEIGTTDGRRVLGSLQPGVGRVVRITGGGADLTLTMSEITSIYPIGASFWRKLDGAFNMGYSYTRSSAIGQLSINTDTTFRRPAFIVMLSISGTVTEQPGTDGDDRGNLTLQYARFRGNWFAGGIGTFENNESLGIKLRSQVGGVFGHRFVNTNRAQLSVGSGLVVNNEQGVDTEPTENFEATVTFRTSYYTYDGSKTNFSMGFDYFPSLSNWGRQRIQFDVSLAQDVWKDLSFSIDLFDTFDSRPPNPDAARNDVGIVTSLGWTY